MTLKKSSFLRLIALLVVYAVPLSVQDVVQSFLTIWNIKRFFCVALYSMLAHEENVCMQYLQMILCPGGTCSDYGVTSANGLKNVLVRRRYVWESAYLSFFFDQRGRTAFRADSLGSTAVIISRRANQPNRPALPATTVI